MRHIAFNVVAPMFAMLFVAFFVAFPKPNDIGWALMQSEPAVEKTDAERSYVRTMFEAHTDALDPPVPEALVRAQGCLLDLAAAKPEQRAVCAPIILEALAAIEVAQSSRGRAADTPALDPKSTTIHHQIAVAAIDLCRSQWVRSTDVRHVPDTPICAVANVQLVSIPQKQ